VPTVAWISPAILFDTPLTVSAVAAGAASIPFIIHLLNRKRYRQVTWAAMKFLLAAQEKNIRRLRLEQITLLAVRTFILLLLVTAMASVMPWTEDLWRRLFPGKVASGMGATRRTHKILVIDGSLSMAFKAGEDSCFDRARAAAARILLESPSGDSFSVILMTSPPRRIVAEPADDPRKVADEIQGLHLPHGNADLTATFIAVEDILSHSPEKYPEKEVYFLTDLQRASWIVRQSNDAKQALRKIQNRARTIILNVGQDGADNWAVTDLTLGPELVTTGAATSITCEVRNYGSDGSKPRHIELWIGKARAISTDPPFDLRVVQQEVVQPPPGESRTVSFPYRFTTPGDYAVQVRLENDGLELDDVRTVVVSVKDTVPVLLVNGKPAAELYDRATEWLKDALNPFVEQVTPRNIPARPKVVSEAQFADAGLGDLSLYDCAFICDVGRLSQGEIRRLETHLQKGGGVVFCLGPQVDIEAYNRLLFREAQGILPARLTRRIQASAQEIFSFFPETEPFKLPPLKAFSGADDRLSLLSARFREYVQVDLPASGRGQTILSFMSLPRFNTENGLESSVAKPESIANPAVKKDPALVAASRFRGQVLLLTTTVNLDWTSWPISPSYLPFMQELLRFAVSGRLRGQAIVVGENLEEVFPLASAGLDAVVHTPEQKSEHTRIQGKDEISLLRWTDTDLSGIYRATIGQHPRDYLFAVNIPATTEAQQGSESDLTKTNADELHAVFPGWDFQMVTEYHQAVHTRGSENPDEPGFLGSGLGPDIARNLLLVMLVLLLVEVTLAWRFGHYSTVTNSENPQASGRWLPIVLGSMASAMCLAVGGLLIHAAWTGNFMGFLPEVCRRWVEARFGIPPPTSGEGTHWRLEFRPCFWDAAADPWFAGFFGLGISLVVFIIYRHEGKTASSIYRLLLAGLRIGLVLLTLTVLLPQLHLLFERQSWPDVVILIDDSRSMSHADQFRESKDRLAAERLARLAGLSNPERLQLAQALLARDQPDWLDYLLTRKEVKIHVYHCSSRAGRIADLADDADVNKHRAALQAIANLRAEGESSQLGSAVRQVLNDFRGTSLAAVVMLTDGVTTEGEDLVKASRHAARMGVPLFFVGLGDDHEIRDLKLHDLQVEENVYVNDRIVFECRLTGQGYQNLSIPVTLKEKDKVLATQSVRIDPNGKPVKFRLFHQPKEPGEKTFVLEAPVPAEEGEPAKMLRLERTIFVRETKLIKVLFVEGYPRYEFRYLKHLLERESDLDPRNKTIDLKTLVLDADLEYPKLDKSAVAEFPSKFELYQFDVVIFGDVDPKHEKIEKHLGNVVDFVRERGGGFLMVAGTRHSPRAFKDCPLRDILAIEVAGPEPSDTDLGTGFHPELTPAGRFHPVFRFSPEEGENITIWNQLADVFWWSECYRAKPGAEVLAVHPHRQGLANNKSAIHDDRHPLVVQQFVGAGRSMFFGIDETWRWRYREGELRFNQFWIQTIRYLARSRLGRVEMRLDRQTPYLRGEPIKVSVRFPDDAAPPPPETEVKVLVERSITHGDGPPETERQTLSLSRVEGSRAIFETLLTQTPAADYRFWLSAPTVTGPKPHAACKVVPPPDEMEKLQMNRQEMEYAARQTKGRFYTLADARELLDDLPTHSRFATNSSQPPWLLWNHPAMFFFVLFLLTSEWFLRKRKHLL
jgi:hypothetical protein